MGKYDEELFDELADAVDFMEGFSDDAQFMGETFEEGYDRYKSKADMLFKVREIGIENITDADREEMINMLYDAVEFLEGFVTAPDPFADEDEPSMEDRVDDKLILLSKISRG